MTSTKKHLMYIPKIIHQSYSTAHLNDEILNNISKIKCLNSTWEYRYYDDDDCVVFIKNNFGDHILQAYNKINPIFSAARADLFRYLLIYKVGGVWLDVKSSINMPLDSTLKFNDYFILSQWQNKMGEPFQGWGLYPELARLPGGEFQQWHIISAPNNPLIEAVIKRVLYNIKHYNGNSYGLGKDGVLRTTGPIAYSIAIAKLIHRYPHRFVNAHSELGFRYTIYANPLGHEKIFDDHYSQYKKSVVIIGD